SAHAADARFGSTDPSFYEKLNTVWHKRALNTFMFIVLAHWAEHLAQSYQIYVLGWPRPQSNGVLGLFYPWLVQMEVFTLRLGDRNAYRHLDTPERVYRNFA